MEVKLTFYGVMHLPRIFVLNGWSLPVLNRSCFSVFNKHTKAQVLQVSACGPVLACSTLITIYETVFVKLQLYLYIAGINIRFLRTI